MPAANAVASARRFHRPRVALRGLVKGLLDCGFLIKYGPEGGYTNRITQEYVGVLVIAGHGQAIDDLGRRFAVGPGDYIQHAPGQPHGVVPAKGQWEEFYLRLPAVIYEALHTVGVVNRQTVLHPGLDPSLLAKCEHLLVDLQQTPQRGLGMRVAQMHELVAEIYRLDLGPGASPAQNLIDEACEALGRDPGHKIDMGDLAQRLGLSYERFRKIFRQHVGVSPGEYRIRQRIDHARRLIAQDGLTVKQTAYRLGYPDPFSFSKQFTRYTGMSPTAFRTTL